EVEHLAPGEPFAGGEHRFEARAGQELHGEKERAVLEEANDVGVGEVAQHLDLALEALAHAGGDAQIGGQQRDGGHLREAHGGRGAGEGAGATVLVTNPPPPYGPPPGGVYAAPPTRLWGLVCVTAQRPPPGGRVF